MGEMKIELILRAKRIKKLSYKLAHRCKPIFQKEIEAILASNIIYPIDKSEWENPMVVKSNKHDTKKIRICVDLWGLNKLIVTNPFPTPYSDDIINEVVGHEIYSFIDGFYGYNQVPIENEDQENTTFLYDFNTFAYKLILFGLKNAPTILSRIVVNAFQ
jgi:hypothetical protein